MATYFDEFRGIILDESIRLTDRQTDRLLKRYLNRSMANKKKRNNELCGLASNVYTGNEYA